MKIFEIITITGYGLAVIICLYYLIKVLLIEVCGFKFSGNKIQESILYKTLTESEKLIKKEKAFSFLKLHYPKVKDESILQCLKYANSDFFECYDKMYQNRISVNNPMMNSKATYHDYFIEMSEKWMRITEGDNAFNIRKYGLGKS